MAQQVNQSLEKVEFTHRWYRQFLQLLQELGYDFRTFSDTLGDRDIVLRHDIDLSMDAAVRMARIEADLDIQSTYCVLLSSPLYNPLEGQYRDAIREIDAQGHEVALHFSTHEYWSEDSEPVVAEIECRVREERSILETIAPPTKTVSFHRPPSWVLDREFEGFENTYGPANFSDIDYIADSSQRWRETPPPIDDLPETFQLLTHPGLWSQTDAGFEQRIQMAVTDACNHANRTARSEFIDGGTN